MTFTQSMKRRSLFVTLCAAGVVLCGASQIHAWELPGRPTHPDQCRPTAWNGTPDWNQWMDERRRIMNTRFGPDCDRTFRAPSAAWTDCYNQGMRRSGEALARHDAIRDQATREYASAQRQCEAIARQNQATIKQQEDNQQRAQQQAQQQRQMAEENQRRMQQQQALQEQQARQQQAAQEQQRRQQQALLEQQQRGVSLADQQRRQQLGNQQQQQALLDQRQREAALSDQQRRQQQVRQQLTLLEQLEEAERQRRLQAGTLERQPQQQVQPARQQPAPVLASVVPRSPTADNVPLSEQVRSSLEQAAVRYEAAMQRTVQVGDTVLSVGGLKDTLVGLATNILASIKSTTLLRGIGRGASTALTNPVLEIAGPFLDPENGKNIFTTVESLRRGRQGDLSNENAARIFRELEEADRRQYSPPPNTPATTDARRSWYRD